MNDDTDLTVNALIDAFLAWDKYRNAHQDLREYHKKRLEILQSIFGCDVEKRQAELDREAEKLRRKVSHNEYFYDIDGRATVEFMQDCIRLLNSTKSPFDCKIYLEGKPPKLVRDLRAKHQKEIRALEANLNQINRDLIEEVLKYLFPGIEDRKVKAARLYEMGLPTEEPDPIDYL